MGILGSFTIVLPQTLHIVLWVQIYATYPKYARFCSNILLKWVFFYAIYGIVNCKK